MLEIGTKAPEFTLPEQAKGFAWSGYAFDEAVSTEEEYVFVRRK
jgi:cytoplasmic iron level regulating protein YaaA (DUF328/UPF0246 family)